MSLSRFHLFMSTDNPSLFPFWEAFIYCFFLVGFIIGLIALLLLGVALLGKFLNYLYESRVPTYIIAILAIISILALIALLITSLIFI